jgi:DNA-binding YbaB/EbfC family protein
MFGKMGDMGKMMGQMKDMKKNLANVQENIKNLEESGGSNGVSVVINGAHIVKSIDIDESLLTDKDLLEDLLVNACNEANQKVVNKSALMMQEVTGGLNLPF